jgi:hypothetical protein
MSGRRMKSRMEDLDSIRAYEEAKASGDEAIPFEQAIEEIERGEVAERWLGESPENGADIEDMLDIQYLEEAEASAEGFIDLDELRARLEALEQDC